MSTINEKIVPLYRNREWLETQKITLNKTNAQIAKEFGFTERVVEKWVGIYGFGNRKYKFLKHLTTEQIQLIEASLLGDGHISQNLSFIVSHNEQQKDYLFWKFRLLENLCSHAPTYYPGKEKEVRGQRVFEKPSYRFNTRFLYDLQALRDKPKIDIINNLTEFQISIWMLDDGYRGPYNWELCFGKLGEQEKNAALEIFTKFGIDGAVRNYDPRYVRFCAENSRKIDDIILHSVPNNLDIIQTKIFKYAQKEVMPE